MSVSTGTLPETLTPAHLRITVLREAYLSGRWQPSEVLYNLRERAARDTHNAWIYLLSEDELATRLAHLDTQDPAALPLYGIPFAIKDNIDLAGVPTTAACPAFTYTPEHSAHVVSRLLAAGAIPLGKTNLDQFATGLVGTRSPYGEGKNAIQPDYISGGSSSGSAISTALGQVSFALGTDTAGSGRVPAAFNNLIGHKPSHGLLSTSGVVPACRSIDCVSIMANTTEDVVLVLNEAVGEDPADPYSRPNPHYNTLHYFGQPSGKFSFAVPDELDFDGDSEAQGLFEATVDQLTSMGGTVQQIPFAPFYAAAKLLYEGPWVAERRLATASVSTADRLPVLEQILDAGGQDGPTVLTAEAAFTAQYQLRQLKRTCDAALAPFDFILTPTTPTVYTRAELAAAPIELNSRLGTYTNFMNLLDYAATAVPVGRLAGRTSWGVTLFSRHGHDYALLSFAQALQNQLNLPLGASDAPLDAANMSPPMARYSATIDLVVCGAHLSGQPLNWQLTSRNAELVRTTHTQSCYTLYALPDGKRPALIRNTRQGAAIEV
ncbi:MAG: allophanate hydrolase, partial [Pseudomonadota bacterium]